MNIFEQRLNDLNESFNKLIKTTNSVLPNSNGVFYRYEHAVLTAEHTPLNWRYDFNPLANPYLLERIGINATFNAGAIFFNQKFVLVVRVEGKDRKSFFAIAESDTGIDNFTFWPLPIVLPETENPDINVYDMRITAHEDGWLYGLFCTERKDPDAPFYDQAMAVAQCGIVRTKDLKVWERLSDLKTNSAQQRNVVLHPEFVEGKYAFYTRPQDSFIEAGKGGGIGFGLSESVTQAVIIDETILDKKAYHTVYEAKNGQGPAPIKTPLGWLHLAHGVRNTAAGLRYVLYMFMTSLDDLTKIIHKPGGYFLAPEGEERIGDVSNVVFCNGWIKDDEDNVYIYYASSDTRMHVATSTIAQLVDYVMKTPEDGLRSFSTVNHIVALVNSNESIATQSKTNGLYTKVQ